MELRRKKRTPDYELELKIHDESFLATPNDVLRNAALNKTVSEFAEMIDILRENASEFVDVTPRPVLDDRSHATLSDDEIMEDWQIPLMRKMADLICTGEDEILEIGFGRGIASTFIQAKKPKKHTIIDCNPSVLDRLAKWRAENSFENVRAVAGKWQDQIDKVGEFDGIFFHTYPLDESEYMDYVLRASTFAEHFFPFASEHLRTGGAFTYLTNEIDSLSRAHQRALFGHFSSVEMQIVELELPADTKDAWWSKRMVVVRAVK